MLQAGVVAELARSANRLIEADQSFRHLLGCRLRSLAGVQRLSFPVAARRAVYLRSHLPPEAPFMWRTRFGSHR